MIFNILRRSDPGPVINYASRNGEALCVAGSFPLDVAVPELTQRFRDVHDLRPELRGAKTLHVMVSFAEKDRPLTETELGVISQEVAEKLGLADGPWQSWLHLDGHTAHLHLIGSSIRYDAHRLETRHLYKQAMKAAREMEIEHGLWRVGMHKDDPLLPPTGKVQSPSGPRIALPPPGIGLKQQVKDIVYKTLRLAPNATLPDLADLLHAQGLELVPQFTKDGTKIQGLGFRWEGGFIKASDVDKTFSLAGLQRHHGVTYTSARDLPRLSPPAPGLMAFRAPETALPAPGEQEHQIEAPVPVIALPPPRLTYEVPHVPVRPPSLFDRAKLFATRLFNRVRLQPPATGSIERPGHHRIG